MSQAPASEEDVPPAPFIDAESECSHTDLVCFRSEEKLRRGRYLHILQGGDCASPVAFTSFGALAPVKAGCPSEALIDMSPTVLILESKHRLSPKMGLDCFWEAWIRDEGAW